MNKEAVAISAALGLLAVVFAAGVAADSGREARQLHKELDALSARLEAHEAAQSEAENRTADKITLLDAHVQYFITGGWK